MDLTLREAAARLQVRPRTLRDRIRRGEQPAYKRGRQWMIRPADLPLTEAQRAAVQSGDVVLHGAVDAAIPRHLKSKLGATTLDQLDVFTAGRALLAELRAAGGHEEAAAALRSALHGVAIGHHRFAPKAKVEAFEQARGDLSRAVADLWLDPEASAEATRWASAEATRWASAIEARVIPRLGGLIRWSETLPERPR